MYPPVTRPQTDPPGAAEIQRARAGVTVIFFVCGAAGAVWYTRLTDVMHALPLTPTQLAVLLLCFALGALGAMQVAGRLIDRFGSRTVLRVASPITAVCLVPLGLAGWIPNLNQVVAPIVQILPPALITGFWYGLMDVAMNAQAVVVEQARQRPMMGSFHAAVSVGYAAGGGLNVVTVSVGWSHHLSLVVVGVVCLVICGFATYPLLNWAQSAGADHDTSQPVRLTRPLLLLGLLAMAAFIAEGAAVEWGKLYLMQAPVHATPRGAAWSIFLFTAFMALARLLADPLRRMLGSARLIRYGAVLAAAGLTVNLVSLFVAPHPVRVVTGMIGFALMGGGLAPAVPELFSAAGRHEPHRAGGAIAKVSTLGYGGYLLGPVVISQVVQHARLGPHLPGTVAAMALLVVLSVAVAVGAGAVNAPSRNAQRPTPARPEHPGPGAVND